MDAQNFWFSSGAAGGGGGDEGATIEQSLRFRGSQHLSRSFSSTSSSFTFSFWTKIATNDADLGYLFSAGGNNPSLLKGQVTQSGFLYNQDAGGATGTISTNPRRFRDPSAWYHIVYQSDGGTHRIFINGELSSTPNTGSSNYNGTFAIGVNTDLSAAPLEGYMAAWYGIDGQALAPTAFGRYNNQGIWVPVAYDGDADDYGANGFHLDFHDIDNLGEDVAPTGATGHTAANNFTPTGFQTNPPKNPQWQTYSTDWGTAYSGQPVSIFSGQATSQFEPPDWYFMTPANAAVITGVLDEAGVTGGESIQLTVYPRQGSVTITMNGSTSQSVSGNALQTLSINVPAGGLTSCTVSGTDATYWGIGAISIDSEMLVNYGSGANYDYMTDSPTQNFSTLNPLGYPGGRLCNCITATNAFLSATATSNPDMGSTVFQLPNSGRYAMQIQGQTGETGPPEVYVQFYNVTNPAKDSGATEGSITCEFSGGEFRLAAGLIPSNSGIPSGTGSQNCTLQILVDCDTQNMWVGNMFGDFLIQTPVGGSGTMTVGDFDITTPTLNYGTIGDDGDDLYMMYGPTIHGINYGQHPYLVTLPDTSFLPLQTQNMPTSTILNGSDHFRALTGTGANILAIAEGDNTTGDNWNPNVNTGFENGLYIIKSRTGTEQWQFVDSTNGDTSVPRSPANTAPQNYFTPAGTALAWCWNAPNAFTNDDVTAGRRNVDAGFSIINYTGDDTTNRRIAHGLNTEPGLMMLFNPDGGDIKVWVNGLTGTGTATQNLILNTGEAASNQFSSGTIHAPDNATDFIVGLSSTPDANVSGVNENGDNYRAFIWAPVPGYSAFGNFPGNSSDDGPFIYCGFKPSLVWLQASGAGGGDSFFTADTTCQTTNPYGGGTLLNMAQNGAEGSNSARPWDILSNGFKIRSSSGSINGGNVVWAAWAENPFGGENTAPVTAH